MRIRAYYNKYIKPKTAEDIKMGVEFGEEKFNLILFDITNTAEAKEVFKGLKENNYKMVAKAVKDTFQFLDLDIKNKDRVIMLGKEYRVQKVEYKITNQRHANMVAKNNLLFNKYAELYLVLE